MIKLNNENFPKTIWFLWLQGLNNAPLVVHKCYESWIKHNPDWTIILLDQNNINNYLTLTPGSKTNQALSDILRINLLAKYGGIWVDATCFCNKPLNTWIYDYWGNGFFAFDKPAPDRMISSWFIAGTTDNYIVAAYQKAVNSYWQNNPELKSFESSKWFKLNKYLQKQDTQIWFGKFITKILKVYPYFWFHYLYKSIYLSDKKIKEEWDATPKFSADIPHKLQFAGLFNAISAEIQLEIDNQISPVYKLTWKYDESALKKGTTLHYVLNGN